MINFHLIQTFVSSKIFLVIQLHLIPLSLSVMNKFWHWTFCLTEWFKTRYRLYGHQIRAAICIFTDILEKITPPTSHRILWQLNADKEAGHFREIKKTVILEYIISFFFGIRAYLTASGTLARTYYLKWIWRKSSQLTGVCRVHLHRSVLTSWTNRVSQFSDIDFIALMLLHDVLINTN